jgi:hypothetical protein
MNVSITIPQELETYIQAQIQSGADSTVADYLLALLELIPKESIKGRECKGKRARIER